MEQTKKRVSVHKSTVALILVIALLCTVFGFLFNKLILNPQVANAATLETKVKLDLYNGMDAVSQNKDNLVDFTLSNIKESLAASSQSLTPEEEAKLKEQLSTKIGELFDAGILKYDESGNLSSESKSFFVNEVLDVFKEQCSNINLQQEIDLTDIYTRLTNLENYVKQIDTNNATIVKSAENVEKLMQMLSVNDSVDSEKLSQILDALKTNVEMNNYIPVSGNTTSNNNTNNNNNNTNATVSANTVNTVANIDVSNASYEEAIKKLQESFNALNEAQSTIVDNLNNTIVKLNQVAENVTANTEEISNLKGLLETTVSDLASAKDSIVQVKNELTDMINNTKTELEASINDLKAELNSYIEANKTEASDNVASAKAELEAAINNSSSLSEQERAKLLEAINEYQANTEQNFATTNETIETNKIQASNDITTLQNDIEEKLNASAELNENERQAIRVALSDYESAANESIAAVNSDLQISKEETTETLETTRQELLKIIGDNKTEISTALNNYITQTDNTLSQLTNTISNNKNEIENKLNVARTELETALAQSNIKNENERNAIRTALNNYIIQTDNSIAQIKESIKKANEIIEANKQEAKINLDNVKNELNQTINNNTQSLNETIQANKTEASNNLNAAKQELNAALNNANTNNKAERNKISLALQNYVDASTESFKEVNKKIEDTNTALANSVKDLKDSIDALKKVVEDNKALSDETDENLQEQITELGNNLGTQINSNASDINSLKTQLSYYLSGSGEHIKIDSINNVTINNSGSANSSNNVYVWTTNNDGTSSVVISNGYLVDCSSVQINYKEQYNIDPTYIIDEENGTLTITTLTSFITSPILINQIVIYHN